MSVVLNYVSELSGLNSSRENNIEKVSRKAVDHDQTHSISFQMFQSGRPSNDIMLLTLSNSMSILKRQSDSKTSRKKAEYDIAKKTIWNTQL